MKTGKFDKAHWFQQARDARRQAMKYEEVLCWVDIVTKSVSCHPASSPIAHKLLEHEEDKTFIGKISSYMPYTDVFDMIEYARRNAYEQKRQRVAGVALTRAIAMCQRHGMRVLAPGQAYF